MTYRTGYKSLIIKNSSKSSETQKCHLCFADTLVCNMDVSDFIVQCFT